MDLNSSRVHFQKNVFNQKSWFGTTKLIPNIFYSIIYFFLNVEFEKFSNLEELYLRGNEITDFITLEGMRL